VLLLLLRMTKCTLLARQALLHGKEKECNEVRSELIGTREEFMATKETLALSREEQAVLKVVQEAKWW